MDRIILIRSGVFQGCLFRAGQYYRLPEDLAEALLHDGWAYREGEDPPFDAVTLAAMAAPYDQQVKAEQRAALLGSTRRRLAGDKAAHDAEVAAAATARAEALRQSRQQVRRKVIRNG